VRIREEQTADAEIVRDVVRAAFGRDDEAALVSALKIGPGKRSG
jgi:predicted N-acetyltransferase YhbS